MHVSNAPYIRSEDNTSRIMIDVLVSLIPASVFGVYIYGLRALIIILICVISCILSEALFEFVTNASITINDGSAIVTGVLLALTLPPTVEWWMPVLGGAFGIIVVKQLYGGLGKNIMNPALAARCFLLISFTGQMNRYSIPFADVVSQATPLACVQSGAKVDVGDMFLGFIPGTIGETSVMAIMMGAIYLVYRKVISLTIPIGYITSFLIYYVLYSLICGNGIDIGMIEAQIFGGGLLFGAFFMATDYVTSPMTTGGQILYSIVIGILTGLYRCQGKCAEGVSYAIICANMGVPIIDKICIRIRSPIGRR